MPNTRKSARPKKNTRSTAAEKPVATAKASSPVLDRARSLYWVVIAIVIVLGVVMLVPRMQSTNTASGSVLNHVVTYHGQDGKKALDLLKASHQVATQQFSIGAFVTSIDGISAPPNYYWAFSVNGKPSDIGADQYVTKNSDVLSWQLQRIQ